jgi:hypothetical protein
MNKTAKISNLLPGTHEVCGNKDLAKVKPMPLIEQYDPNHRSNALALMSYDFPPKQTIKKLHARSIPT